MCVFGCMCLYGQISIDIPGLMMNCVYINSVDENIRRSRKSQLGEKFNITYRTGESNFQSIS